MSSPAATGVKVCGSSKYLISESRMTMIECCDHQQSFLSGRALSIDPLARSAMGVIRL